MLVSWDHTMKTNPQQTYFLSCKIPPIDKRFQALNELEEAKNHETYIQWKYWALIPSMFDASSNPINIWKVHRQWLQGSSRNIYLPLRQLGQIVNPEVHTKQVGGIYILANLLTNDTDALSSATVALREVTRVW